MMKTTTWVILMLAVMDLGVLILARWFDRRSYIPTRTMNQLPATESFFNNRAFDELFNHFFLSKGGMLLLSVLFVSVLMLTAKIPHGTI